MVKAEGLRHKGYVARGFPGGYMQLRQLGREPCFHGGWSRWYHHRWVWRPYPCTVFHVTVVSTSRHSKGPSRLLFFGSFRLGGLTTCRLVNSYIKSNTSERCPPRWFVKHVIKKDRQTKRPNIREAWNHVWRVVVGNQVGDCETAELKYWREKWAKAVLDLVNHGSLA